MKLIGICSRERRAAREAPYIEVKVGGKKGIFRIDTGSDLTVIPEEIFPVNSPIVKELNTRLSSGDVYRRDTFKVPLKIGEVSFDLLEGVFTTTSEIGFLGLDILRSFRFTLEGERYTLELLSEKQPVEGNSDV
jgi:hypothetical protein